MAEQNASIEEDKALYSEISRFNQLDDDLDDDLDDGVDENLESNGMSFVR